MAEISLDNISVYNAKASLVISQVVADGDTGKANMMSSLKTTANDTTLSDAIRLNALTALINLGSLLDVPLPPYFPIVTTYANTQTYVGIHNDLSGIQGGVPGEYYHLTLAERTQALNAATQGDITFANLSGVYSDNASLVTAFQGKQNALSGTGFVRISGTTISYDNSTYLTTISGIAAGGELSGTYPNPALSNAAVISKVLTGFTGVALPTPITSSDTILSAMQKLNNNISSLIVSPSGVASVALTTNAGGVFTTTTSPQTGAATLNISLNSQSANLFLASPNGSSGTPSFRAFVVADLPNSGATAGTYGSSSFIPQIVVDAKGRITSISSVSAAAGGQVNTVTLTQPGIFGAVTNIGTASNVNLNYGLSTQIANYVWAGPISGANAVPAFRALVVADIPDLPTTKITGLDAQLSGFLTDSLSDGSIWIGNTSNAAVQRVLSGDVTVSNTGVTAIGLAKVQYNMIQDVTTQTLLGRYSAVDGEVQQITLLGTDFVLDSGTGVLSLASPVAPVVSTKGDLLGHDLTTQQRVPSSNIDGDILLVNNSATGAYTDLGLNWVTMSGDATIAASGAITIGAGAVTLAKMANLANNRIIGNVSGGAAAPSALTGTQVTGMLDLFSSSTGTKGLVPGSNGNTTYFLRGDLSWQPITGTGTVTAVSIATANGFAGTSSGGATPALTITLNSLNGVLKGTGTAIAAATAGTDYISPGQITQTSGAGSGLTMASGNILGRTTASAGVIEAIGVNSSLSLGSLTLGLNLGNGNIFTVQQQMPSIRLNGATSGFVSFTPPAVAGAQVYELPAAVPSGAGQYLTATTGGVLSWSSPAGSGTTTNAVTFNNGGSGDASGTTFNGSAARTISYNTIGAQLSNANLTGLSALSYASGTPLVRMTAAGTFSLDNGTYLAGTATQYAVLVGGATNSVSSIATSSSNKILISNGVSANPSWTDATYLSATTQYGILYSSATNVVSEILPPGTAGLFLQWTGSGYTWASGGGGGGSGTVTNVSVVTANGFSGSVANSTTTPAITLSTTITGLLKGSAGALIAATPGTDYLTSVGLTMPSAFTVTTSPLTANGTLAVTGAGTVSQYVRGDGSLANFPTAGGGGSSVSYYLNGSVTQFGSYRQMSKVPITGGGTNFTLNNTTGFQLMAQFVTDANDPSLLSIPAGAWDIGFYFSSSNNTGNPAFYVELLKYDGSTFTTITNNSANAEIISNGTAVDLYNTSLAISSSTSLTLTDRLVIRVYVDTAGSRTITFHTEDANLAQIITTFTTGITALNGLTEQVQSFANGSSGTAPAFVSSTATHTLNIPLASAASVTAGLLSNTDYTTFSNKITNPMTTLGDIIYGGALGVPTALTIGSTNQVLAVVGGVPAWTSAGGGDVTSVAATSPDPTGNFAVFNSSTGKEINTPAAASLTAAGRATFNDGVDVGASSATQGTIVFRNSSNAFTTTIQASTSAAANLIYYWPTSAPAAGNILSSDASGNLSWTAAGAGNMVLATAGQIVTGSKIYSDTTLLLRNPAQTFSTTLSAGTSLAARTITFPDLTGTVALLDNSQIFTGAKTFQAQVNIGNATYAASTLSFGGTTSNAIGFPAAGTAVPSVAGARTAGVRIALAPPGNYSLNVDFAIGMASSTEMYIGTSGVASTEVSMYFGASKLGAFQTQGLAINRTSASLGASGGQLVINGGASTTLGQGNALSFINFYTSVSAAPTDGNARSNGTRIVLQPNIGVSSIDAAIGYNDTDKETWITGARTNGVSDGRISFYAGGNTASTSFRRVGYFSGTGLVFDSAGNATNAPITFNATTINWINFGTIGNGAPSAANSRSAGTKICLYPNVSVNQTDYAIGVNTTLNETWISGGTTAAGDGSIGFYAGTATTFKRTVWVSGNALNLAASTVIVGTASQDVFNTVSTTVNFAGAATALTIGATTGTATIRNAILNLSNASGQLQINATKVVGTRETGYVAFTGTTNKGTTYATGTVTLIQLAERVAALQASLTTHGLIGT